MVAWRKMEGRETICTYCGSGSAFIDSNDKINCSECSADQPVPDILASMQRKNILQPIIPKVMDNGHLVHQWKGWKITAEITTVQNVSVCGLKLWCWNGHFWDNHGGPYQSLLDLLGIEDLKNYYVENNQMILK